MIALNLMLATLLTAATPPSLAALHWDKRVLLVSAPNEKDPLLHDQRRVIRRWQAGAQDRDLVVVEIVGDAVSGAADAASRLRRSFGLPTAQFAVVLIGKDGGTKLRQKEPISSAILEKTIDAMPMRRSGGR
jgi:hypothetical protein